MSACSQVRWQLNEFLSGALSDQDSERVREHLDDCRDCSLQMTQPARLERHLPSESAQLANDFTERLLRSFPQTTPAMAVVRSLAIVFAASAGFAVSIYLIIRDLLAPSVTGVSVMAAETGALAQALEHIVVSPIARYGLLALAAVSLCALVIAIIDRPQQSHAAESR